MPSLKLRGKFFTRHRTEDDSMVVKVGSMDERDFLLKTKPSVFFITDHYRDYPAVLVRLATVGPQLLADMLEQAWRRAVTRQMITAFDAAKASGTVRGP